jgi:hypothetical protein
MTRMFSVGFVVAGTLLLTIRPRTPTIAAPTSQPARVEPERLMLDIAQVYSRWGPVDAEGRWAPYLCRAPIPGWHRFSESDDPSTHGQKIYALYAENRDAYVGLNDALPKNGPGGLFDSGGVEKTSSQINDECDQIVVKESFTPVEMRPDEAPRMTDLVPAQRDGKAYRAGEKRELFVMAHLVDASRAPEGSVDQGWIYGTISPDGKSVTSVGRVASCMKCHVDAPYGRLFGLTKPKSADGSP